MVATPSLSSISQRPCTGDAEALRKIFTGLDATSCPHTYNFHMHTACSDGKLVPSALMEQVVDIGLQAFAITDHHTVKGYRQAKAWLEDWQWRNPTSLRRRGKGGSAAPRLFTGVEVTAILADTEVHLLGYGFSPSHDAMEPYLRGYAPRGEDKLATAVIPAIQAAGGIAVLAHPARYRVSANTLIPAAAALGIDGVETYYAYANPEDWAPCPRHTPTVEQLARDHRLLTTCGTDTHGASLLRRL
ncbi:PHP domain-containing protein [Nodosilinea sp. LEGE 07088]|uniref:PHP domain-containing protein n=1 Tax=Nodosilinea sp. LEGE 07088 TaxID=2777968 RepID=UPI00187FB8D3|nr:PHP domain-containing protein [Nodosilinea sp. LEGE 07088]MBE9137316.1 PHP domain-containing protein [Nodosilinea sp. LEGE 07088]